jgi:hypothetical protein
MGPHSRSVRREGKKYPFVLAGMESLFLSRAARRCTDWAILALTVSCVDQNKRSVSPFVYRPIITSTHSCSLLHVSFQNKPPPRQLPATQDWEVLLGFVLFDVTHVTVVQGGRSLALLGVVSTTTTALRGWVIIVEGGNSGYLPCVSDSVHITGIVMVMPSFIIYTSVRLAFLCRPAFLQPPLFFSNCIHTSTQLWPTVTPLFFVWIESVKTVSERLTGENCTKLTSSKILKGIRYGRAPNALQVRLYRNTTHSVGNVQNIPSLIKGGGAVIGQRDNCKIWGYHGGDYEEWCLVGCYAAWLL